MDLGCSKHVTSHITDYIEYTPFNSPVKAEIADKKELDILGVGTIAIRHTMMDGKISNITLSQVLFVPTTNRWFYLTCIATEKGCEAHQTRRSHDVYSSDGTKFITRTRKTTSGLFFFKAEVLRKQDSKATILVLKLNTHDLWHQRLGHANSQVIKALPAHAIGGPATGAVSSPTGLCNGCEKGKSKRLPFPPSKSRAETTLALVHSDLDKMSTASINGWLHLGKWCNKLGIPTSKDSCTFSGRIRIYGASSNRTPMHLAQELQRGDRIPIYSSHDDLCRQPSCNILSNKSSSWTEDETHWYLSPLHLWTSRD